MCTLFYSCFPAAYPLQSSPRGVRYVYVHETTATTSHATGKVKVFRDLSSEAEEVVLRALHEVPWNYRREVDNRYAHKGQRGRAGTRGQVQVVHMKNECAACTLY